MDAFESLVGFLLEKEGYWVRRNLKVELTPEDKKKIKRPTSPRWEVDVLAYKAKSNELLVVECKSYLDSTGVRAHGLDGTNADAGQQYKLFNDSTLRKVILARLVKQLVSYGLCAPRPTVTLCLAAGNIASETDRESIGKICERHGWRLYDDAWIKEKLLRLSRSGYENDVASYVAKILLRK
ncbi:MAG: hypothetical protein WBR15_02130 [Gammaproteobacteria bacterium]